MTWHRTAALCATLFATGAPRFAWADAEAAQIAAISAASASRGRARTSAESPRRELRDWIDPRTGATSRLAHGCDHDIEVRLSGSGIANYLDLSLSNRSEAESSFDAREASARFENGVTRRLAPGGAAEMVLPKGWLGRYTLSFPSKEDFRDQNRMLVQIPITMGDGSRCIVPIDLERPTGVLPDARTYMTHRQLELFFSGGVRVAAAGGVRQIGDDIGGALDFGLLWLPWVYHGFSFDIGGDFFGSSGVSRVTTRSFERPSISGAGFFIGYAFRLYVTPWLSATYTASPGAYVLELHDDAEGRGRRSHLTDLFLPLRQKVSIELTLARLFDGSQFGIAPVLSHTFIPFGSYGSADATGHVVTAMLRLYLGG